MKKEVLISVIMPVYNGEAYLKEAIESILWQTMEEFELIVVNDGSTDNSENVILSFNDKRIKTIFTQHIGCFPARNIGMRAAKGKYIAVMDADDVCLPERLMIQYNFLEENKQYGLVSTALQYMNTITPVYKETDYDFIKIMMLRFSYLGHATSMIRKSLVYKYNLFYEEFFKYGSDYAWMSRSSWLFPITNINTPLYLYRIHPNQISTAKIREQIYFANIIRMRQFSYLGLKVDSKDKIILSDFIQGKEIENINLDKIQKWINILLTNNKIFNYYSQEKFHLFLNTLWKQTEKKTY